MENHDILSPALQKYYSALKCLDEFGSCGNFFDDVSRLDSFFSEFRNITFVIQKVLKTEENKKVYSDLRDEFLSGETLKWFVSTRNKTTKEKPFPLKKELIIDIYLPHGTYRLKSKHLIVNFDETFDDALDAIKEMFINKLGLVEIYFSSRIVFSEEGMGVDLYPKIKSGLSQMNGFMKKIKDVFPCSCDTCNSLKELVEQLYKSILFKEINFVSDYSFEKELIVGDNAEIYFSYENSNYISISNMRSSLDNHPIYGDANGCVYALFEKFITTHVVIFQMQNHDIMPTFMIVFSDNTHKMVPFVATTRSTFYRKVNEIIDSTDFDEVVAVFYCGEYYCYDIERFFEINGKPYSERTDLAQNEMLCFTMLLKGGEELSVSFDESEIDNVQYVVEQMQELRRTEHTEKNVIDWLNP